MIYPAIMLKFAVHPQNHSFFLFAKQRTIVQNCSLARSSEKIVRSKIIRSREQMPMCSILAQIPHRITMSCCKLIKSYSARILVQMTTLNSKFSPAAPLETLLSNKSAQSPLRIGTKSYEDEVEKIVPSKIVRSRELKKKP